MKIDLRYISPPSNSALHIVETFIVVLYCLCGGLAGLGDLSLTETVVELAAHNLQVAHAASSGGLTPLGLDRPVVGTDLGRRISALGAGVLLDVVRRPTATTTQRVGLIATFSKAGSTLGHFVALNAKRYRILSANTFLQQNGNGKQTILYGESPLETSAC